MQETHNSNDEVDFFEAVKACNIDKVEEMLKRDVNVNMQNHESDNPLHFICRMNENEIQPTVGLIMLKLLWEHGAKINAKGGLRRETALHCAVKSQKVEAVEFLLSNGANVNARDREGRTPLHLAAKFKGCKNEAILNLLTKNGANLHAQDQWWRTPLIEAVCSDNHQVVAWLLKAGSQIDFVNRSGLTALFYACETRNPEMLRLLIQHQGNVNVRDQRKRSTPLHFIAGSGRYHHHQNDCNNAAFVGQSAVMAQSLLDAGADIDAQDSTGSTSLHLAVDVMDEGFIETLLKNGAKVNVKDDYGTTPLHIVSLHESNNDINSTKLKGIAQMLIENGAEVNALNENLEIPLHYAVFRGNLELVRYLLDNDGDIKAPWYSSKRALNFLHESPVCNTPEICGEDLEEVFSLFNVAVCLGHVGIIDLMISKIGCNVVEIPNDTGNHDVIRSPLFFAVKSGHYKVAKLLLDSGCKVNRPVLHNTTALHVAVSNGHSVLVYLLLEYGASVEVKDFYGRTPLTCALEYERSYLQQVIKILVMHQTKNELIKLTAHKEDLEKIGSRKWLAEFYNQCRLEMSLMKDDVLIDSVSVQFILNKNIEHLTTLMRNEKIVESVTRKNFKINYPIYSDMIKIHIDLALEKQHLLDSTKCILSIIIEKIVKQLGYQSLPDAVLHKISTYFCVREMQDLLKMKENDPFERLRKSIKCKINADE